MQMRQPFFAPQSFPSCLMRTFARIHLLKRKTVGCGVFIISSSHVLKCVHCFAIVDESCTLLSACMWLLRMSIGTSSWREDAPNCQVVWRVDWANPDFSHPHRKSQAEPLLQRALVPSVSCELTLPAVPTPPLPEPGEEVVRQNFVTLTPENRWALFNAQCHVRQGRHTASDSLDPLSRHHEVSR